MKRNYRSYEESLLEALKDRDEAIAYLNAALQDEDPRIIIIAIKHVHKVHDAADILPDVIKSVQSGYGQNLTLSSFLQILKALKCSLVIEKNKSRKKLLRISFNGKMS